MNPFELYHTITTKFILPMICKKNTNYHSIMNNSFINAYVADYRLPEHDDNLMVVHEKPGELDCIKIQPKTEYKIDDGHYAYIYEIPEKHKKDYNLILDSEYTLISKEHKDRLLNFWKETNPGRLHYLLNNELYNYVDMEKLNVLRWAIPRLVLSEEIYWRV